MRVDRDNHRQQTLNRQSFLKLVAAGTVAAALPGLSCTATGRKGKPNIIFILADDLGYGDIGAFGQTRIRTPHIDRLAAEGIKLANFYAGSTVCAPSRSCLMTGLHKCRPGSIRMTDFPMRAALTAAATPPDVPP